MGQPRSDRGEVGGVAAGGGGVARGHGDGAAQAPRRLSRERILDAATTLFSSHGEDAVTMRRIAQELDVWPMGLYRYFADKDALLDALAEEAAAKLELPDSGLMWRDRLADLVRQIADAVQRYPGATRLPLDGPGLPPAAGRIRDAGVGALVEAGLGPEEAARAWRALLSQVYGAAATGAAAGSEYGIELLLDALEQRVRS